jgi:hypothetical protein
MTRRRSRRIRPAPTAAAAALCLALAACGQYGGDGGSGGGGGDPAPVSGVVDPVTPGVDGVAAFQQTVHPMLVEYCTQCHAGAGPGSPSIAHPDPAAAYDAVVINQKVDLANPDRSRLVRRLVADFHNCWSDCIADGAAMTAAIEQWATLIAFDPGGITNVAGTIASASATLAEGIEDTGQERHARNLVALFEFKEGTGSVARDTSGVDPPLDLTLEGTEWMSNHGIEFLPGRATATRDASRKLYDRIAEPQRGTQQYSVEAWVIPANVTQEGPARIASYSASSGSRNFTLGQTLYNYVFRNRSLAEGVSRNGTPELSTSDADQDLQATLQHVVITYDQYRGRRVHVNGAFTDDEDPSGPGRLWSWDPNFVFLLGDELTGDRSWLGKLQLVAIYDHALTQAQITQNFNAGVGKRLILRFDLAAWAGAGAMIEFTVSEFDEFSYLFCSPTFLTTNPSGLRVAGIRVAVNGQAPVAGQSFANVDALVTETRQLLSPQCAVIGKDQGPAADSFSIEFDAIGAFQGPGAPDPPPPPPVIVDPGELPAEGMRDFERIHTTMAALTGVDPNTPAVRATFDELRQQLPGGVDLRAFSSSNQVGIAKLALEYCDAMVESTALRDAFFGAAPPFPFDSPATLVFADPLLRDRLAVALADRMYGVALANQPTAPEVAVALDPLFDDLTAGCDAATCGPERTRTIVKAACAAVLSSAGVHVH